MRKCSNCDRVCADNEKFCQNCGLPTTPIAESVRETADDAVEMPAKKKKTGLILGICGAIAALAAILAIVLFPKREKNDPMRRFFDAQENFIQNKELVARGLTVDSLMSGEFHSDIQSISTDAELTVDIAGLDLSGVDLAGLSLGELDISDKLSKLSLFFQIDSSETDSLTGLQLRYNGSSIISATIDKTENGFGIYIPELSDKRYELSSEFLSRLMSGADELGALEDLPQTIEVKFDRIEDLKKSFEALKKDYEDIFYKGFAVEDFVQKDGNLKLEHLGIEVSGAQEITYTPNAERLASMFSEMAERLKSDKALSDHLLSLMQHYLGENGMKIIISALNAEDDIDLEEKGLLPVFEKIADSLNSDRDEVIKAINDAKLSWRVVSKEDDVLAQYITWDKGDIVIERNEENTYFDLTADGKNYINFSTDLKKDGEVISGKATLLENDNALRAEITVDGCDPTVKSVLGIPVGKFDVALSGVAGFASSSKLTLNIEVAKSANGGTDHRVSMDGLRGFIGEEAPERIAFNLHTTDKASSISRPNAEVVRVESQEQLDGIIEEMSENLTNVFIKLAMLFIF